jgi:hypothetical protein
MTPTPVFSLSSLTSDVEIVNAYFLPASVMRSQKALKVVTPAEAGVHHSS